MKKSSVAVTAPETPETPEVVQEPVQGGLGLLIAEGDFKS